MAIRFTPLLIAFVLSSCSTTGSAALGNDAEIKLKLIGLETGSWKAWKDRDGAYFSSFLSQDHMEVGFTGPADKAAIVSFVGSTACSVGSYDISDFRYARISKDTAILVYHAQQQTVCGGKSVPSPVWATSLYVYRKGYWKNAMYQQTPASH